MILHFRRIVVKMYVFVLEAFERPIAKATDASHIVVRRSLVSGCEFMGYRLFRRPQISFLFVIVFVCLGFWDCGVVGLCVCGFVSLWVCGLVFCGFVCVCVCVCVFVFVCMLCAFGVIVCDCV